MEPKKTATGISSSSGSSSGRSFISRAFTIGKDPSSSRDSAKGPFGLTTLFEKCQPVVVHLVFVHGLGGGSESTWTHSAGPFWPKDWLPLEPDFQDVAVHTFGYNSNFKKSSNLDIHDFSKSLLANLQDCPSLLHSPSPIILVGHSMGGLVIKKAFILAKQISLYKDIATLVHGIFFLATPHQGSNLAETLGKILRATPGARPFLKDLRRNSQAVKSINEEFPQYSQDLQLQSFYETKPLSLVLGIIVPKENAVLGYENERPALLNGDHRSICKFDSPYDTNYKTLRNALARTISEIRKKLSRSRQEPDIEGERILNASLEVKEAPEDDLLRTTSDRLPGSCQWLHDQKGFAAWHQSEQRPPIFWMQAKPATGKSFVCGYLIDHLKHQGLNCCYYFFQHGDRTKSSIPAFLKSMAWQLASIFPEVRQVVISVCRNDESLCRAADYRVMWRKLWLEGILKVTMKGRVYWVIDALDECYWHLDLVGLLIKIQALSSIRIFTTCRQRYDSTATPLLVNCQSISIEDTQRDISKYLDDHSNELPVDNAAQRQAITGQILSKSSGCFLWAHIVLQRLKTVHTSQEIRAVLDEIPSEMNDLYARILVSLSSPSRWLATPILTWVVCGIRPLSIEEVQCALEMEIKDKIASIQGAIHQHCNELVYIDQQSQVRILHSSARDFLLRSGAVSDDLAGFIEKQEGHTRLATTCLDYLNSVDMKARNQRRLSATKINRSPFANYACKAVFEHVNEASSSDDEILRKLATFLSSTNVLSWIEHLAQSSDLETLLRAGQSLKTFLRRRSRTNLLLGDEVIMLDAWATDLVKLVIKFGAQLLAEPSTIFNLVPAFCPRDTAPNRQFAAGNKEIISVVGLSTASWDDCLCTIVLQKPSNNDKSGTERLRALGTSEKYFAIGTSAGKVAIYNESTCLEERVFSHDASVHMLQFSVNGSLLVTASFRKIRIWNCHTWEQKWEFPIVKDILALTFADGDRLLLVALKNNQLIVWSLLDGEITSTSNWIEKLDEEYYDVFRGKFPNFAAFNLEFDILAIAYRAQDLLIWDFEENTYKFYNKEVGLTNPKTQPMVSVQALAFSRLPGISLLAAQYNTGEMTLFNTVTGKVKATTNTTAQDLVSSPDGRTLAGSDVHGTIELWDFETLKYLYRIKAQDYGISALSFNYNNSRLLDIRGRGRQCRVWEPAALYRRDIEQGSGKSLSSFNDGLEGELYSWKDENLITSLTCKGDSDIFFVGKQDGSVSVYSAKDGLPISHSALVKHGNGILALYYDNSSSRLTSTDSAGRLMLHEIYHKGKEWLATLLFDHRGDGVSVEQFLCNPGTTKMLICSAQQDTLYSDNGVPIKSIEWEDRETFEWGQHPSDPKQLLLFSGGLAHVYSWDSFDRLTNPEGILLTGSIIPELRVQSLSSCFGGTVIIAKFSDPNNRSKSRFFFFPSSDFTETSDSTAPILDFQNLANDIENIIGSHGQRLIFLHRDGWICSTTRDTFRPDLCAHYFAPPTDWLKTNDALIIDIAAAAEILFVKRDEVAIIKRGLERTFTLRTV